MQINPSCPVQKRLYGLSREFKPELSAIQEHSLPGINCIILINSKLEEKEKMFWVLNVQESHRYYSNRAYTDEEFYFYLYS